MAVSDLSTHTMKGNNYVCTPKLVSRQAHKPVMQLNYPFCHAQTQAQPVGLGG